MKKIIASILLLVLLTTSVAFASNESSIGSSSVQEKVQELLYVASLKPDDYLMENVNFANLKMGEAVNSYRVVDPKVRRADEITYYPIWDGNQIVAVATAYQSGSDSTVMIDTSFSEALNEWVAANSGKNVFLVWIGNRLYASNGQTVGFLKEDIIDADLSANILDYDYNLVNPEEIIMNASILATEEIDNTKASELEIMPRGGTTKNLSVPIVSQGNYPLCWAASVASVGEYETGRSRTAKKVADYAGIDYNSGATKSKTCSTLNSLYSLNYSIGGKYSTTTIQSKINSGKPIISFFKNNSEGMGHVVVMRGYFKTTGSFAVSLMDPNRSSYFLLTASAGNNFTLPYAGYNLTYDDSCSR